MGEEFVEPAEVVRKRKAFKTKIDWNTNDTYSMSFYSMYVDFPSWSVVNVPLLGKNINLQTFWGNSSASVVLYEIDDSGDHRHTNNNYVLAVQV